MAAYTTLQDIVVIWSGLQGPPPTLVSLAISPSSASVAKGLKQQFQAIGTMSDSSQVDYTALATWTSGTGSVATINSSGLATTLTTGTSSIGASVGAITATGVTLTVTAAVIASIALTPSPSTVAKGLTQQYVATATFTDSSTSDISSTATWVSSNTAVATINASGLATSLTLGTTNITAAKSGVTSPNDVFTVTAAVIASIAVTPSAPSVALGLTQQFTATATFTDASTSNVTSTATWVSSDATKATISASGLATTVAQGTTNITAQKSSVTSPSDTLTVAAPALVSIALSPASPSVAVPNTQQFTATGTYTDASTANITSSATWASSDTSKATIGSATGLATAVAAGSTNITAALSGITSPADAMTVTAASFSNTTSVQMTGSTQGVLFPSTVGAFVQGSAFTISFWVKSNGGVNKTLMGNARSSPYVGWEIQPINNNTFDFTFAASGSNYLEIRTAVVPNMLTKWVHFALVYSGVSPMALGTFTAYVNGAAVSLSSINATLGSSSIANANGFMLGNRVSLDNASTSSEYNNVAFYNYAASSADVAAIYNIGDPPDLSLLASYSNCTFWTYAGTNDTLSASGFIDHKNAANGSAQNTPTLLADFPVFSPYYLQNLKLWLDANTASAVTVSGSNVTAWKDQSTNAFSFTEKNGLNALLSTGGGPNSTNAIDFATNAACALVNASMNIPTAATAFTLYIVFKYRQPATLMQFQDAAGNGMRLFAFNSAGWLNLQLGSTANYPATRASSNFGSVGTWYAASLNFDGVTTYQWYDSNVSATTTTGTADTSTGLTNFWIGNDTAQSTHFADKIAEIILVVGGQSTSAERARVESYFHSRYGL